MPANMVLLEKITVGAAGASSVTFSGIPQTGYTDLVVKMSGRSNGSGGHAYSAAVIKFNGSSSNYSRKLVYQYGNGVVGSNSGGSTGEWLIGLPDSTYTASTFGNAEMYIHNYTSANYKSISSDGVDENNSSTEVLGGLLAGLWSDVAAITSIDITPASGSFVQYTTFYLYGVAKLGTTPAIVPYATGGDTIMTDGTYWYHTFVSSGTFTPAKALSCDYLVVGGGAGGGGTGGGAPNDWGGGGGAGGFSSSSAQSLTTTSYSVTIGAGGAINTDGNSSIFNSVTRIGGGAGGYGAGGASPGSVALGRTGASGGGGSANVYAGGTGTQGFNGSAGSGGAAGGGGGSSAAGGTTGASTGGAGGAGTASSISGSSVTYAGGGGGGGPTGGAGGSGGGGAGATGAGNGTAGTPNTGSGGGGASGNSPSAGAAGGSGIVIVRYAV